MYKLEHLNTTTAQGLPLYPVRLTPTGPALHYKESYLQAWATKHDITVHQSGYCLYFNSEQDAVFFMLGHRYETT